MLRYRGPRRRGMRSAPAPATLPDHFPRKRRRLTKRSRCGSGESRSRLPVKAGFPERSQFNRKSSASGFHAFSRRVAGACAAVLPQPSCRISPGRADAERRRRHSHGGPWERGKTRSRIVSPNEANSLASRFVPMDTTVLHVGGLGLALPPRPTHPAGFLRGEPTRSVEDGIPAGDRGNEGESVRASFPRTKPIRPQVVSQQAHKRLPRTNRNPASVASPNEPKSGPGRFPERSQRVGRIARRNPPPVFCKKGRTPYDAL